MTLEELADLIRANSANTNRRVDQLREDATAQIATTHNETYGQLLNIQNDLTDVRGGVKTLQGDVKVLQGDMTEVRADVGEIRRTLDLADMVAAMKRQIETLEAEVAALKRRA